MSGTDGGSGAVDEGDGSSAAADEDDAGSDAADEPPPEFDPADVSGSDIEPIGGMIAVAFTGAVIGLVGAGFALFVSDLGLALIGVGVVVALSSPLAYVRLRRRYGS
ncbi:hypothetical protein [Halorubrum sp. Eb13]|uniref:hypothetical protein n=1 Tax=Halorubrum sp. Eb13 TaxID=1383843 RepID=UPI000B998B2B|nr:hypothetical protein [Halorubrum sp. Eb13]OYR40198.1 hypothetical protein DJ75_15905 [Halorubrum sp. Eb13]